MNTLAKVLLAGISIVSVSSADVPHESRVSHNDPVVLSWEALDRLPFEKRTQYIKELANVFGDLKTDDSLPQTTLHEFLLKASFESA